MQHLKSELEQLENKRTHSDELKLQNDILAMKNMIKMQEIIEKNKMNSASAKQFMVSLNALNERMQGINTELHGQGEDLDKITDKIFDLDKSLEKTEANVAKSAWSKLCAKYMWILAAALLTLINIILLIIKFKPNN